MAKKSCFFTPFAQMIANFAERNYRKDDYTEYNDIYRRRKKSDKDLPL